MGPRADERCYLNVSATPFLHFPSCPTAPIFFSCLSSPLPHTASPSSFPSPPLPSHTCIPGHFNSFTIKLPHIPPRAHRTVHCTQFSFICPPPLHHSRVIKFQGVLHGCGHTCSFQLSFAFVCCVLPPCPPSLPPSVLPSINQVPFLHLLHQSSSGHGVPP